MLRGGRSAAALVRSLATPEKAENREEEEAKEEEEEEEEEEEAAAGKKEDSGEGPSEAGRAKVSWCRITVR